MAKLSGLKNLGLVDIAYIMAIGSLTHIGQVIKMAKEKMLYSLDGLRSVRSSKLREFRIEEWNTFDGIRFALLGMFNKTESFEFGIFLTDDDAKNFLEKIHRKIEGGK